jgi:hypothetical protein
MRNLARIMLLLTSLGPALCRAQAIHPKADHSRDSEIHNADTLAWWHTTEALSNDDTEGRDTGTAAYQRAAEYVAGRFKAAGLAPAGDNGTYFQNVPMHQLDVVPEGTSFVYKRLDGTPVSLDFLKEISITASPTLPATLTASITFRGYCGKEAMADITGKIVLCFGSRRAGMPSAAERTMSARSGGAVGMISVDDITFTIEPPRWPDAYSRSVTLKDGATSPRRSGNFVTMRVGTLGFSKLVASKEHEPGSIIMAFAGKLPLPSFDLPGTFTLHTKIAEKEISSPNVLAVLPGSDPELKDEYVVVSAHLDGYGYGTPVKGDDLYNGTLDDAAYVALLIQLADDLHMAKETAHIPRTKRSILFAAFTGEEKGLLGSHWYVEHPTVPLVQTAADVNLDQLRPLFPLHILTAEALADTTLGDTAKKVGASMHIELRPDHEPERNLLFRADQVPFLQAHVPAISFIFGYDKGTDAEKRYREWYDVRYHRPQDDLTQPMDFDAARTFNTFFYSLVEAIADTPERPAIYPASQFAAKQAQPLRQ